MGSTTHPEGAGLAVSPEGVLEGSRSAILDTAAPAGRCRERAVSSSCGQGDGGETTAE